MIYDLCLFSQEFSMLKVQMDELSQFTVTHVCVEGNMTFTGIHRQQQLGSSHWIDLSEGVTTWEREALLRNALKDTIEQVAQDDDIVIIRDADEIVSASAIAQYIHQDGIRSLQMNEYHLFVNAMSGHQTWRHPKIMRWRDLKDKLPNNIRNEGAEVIENAGWHCSWTGSVDNMLHKFKSFSHQEKEVQQKANLPHILECMEMKKHLFTGLPLTIVDMAELPEYIQKNQARYDIYKR